MDVLDVHNKGHKNLYLTLCLSTCITRRKGSYRSLAGSTSTGDCRCPLLHKFHSGFNSPQKSGPKNIKRYIKTIVINKM